MKTLAIIILVISITICFVTMFQLIHNIGEVVLTHREILKMHTKMIDDMYEGIRKISSVTEYMMEKMTQYE